MNEFIWVDLSTFDAAKAKRFYSAVLGWSYDTDPAGYSNASTAGAALPTAGLYPMPDFYRKIKMPSFWMSYIQVADIDAVVAKAEELGGKIELQEDNALGRIALIRDPLGAGFTCIQNDQLTIGEDETHGHYMGSELVISDLARIQPFYEGVFGWSFIKTTGDGYILLNDEGGPFADVQVASNKIKGDKEYWAVYFAVQDLGLAAREIEQAGGEIVYRYTTRSGKILVARDNQGATFNVMVPPGSSSRVDTKPLAASDATSQAQLRPSLKWRAALGLVGVYLIVLLEQDWAWGLLFLFWVVPDLKTGVTYFIEPVTRRDNPVLYWAIVVTWLALSAYLLITPLLG